MFLAAPFSFPLRDIMHATPNVMAGEARIVRQKLTEQEVRQLADDTFGDMVKVTVDIARQVLGAGGMLHADVEALLLEDGSIQQDVWGANYFPGRPEGSRVEYSALINIRSAQNNPQQAIESQDIRAKVRQAVERWVGPA